MYWTDTFNGKLDMANMDGSNVRSFHSEYGSSPSSELIAEIETTVSFVLFELP